MKAIKRRVADGDIRDLIWKFLRAGVIYKGEFAETLTGTPQGGIVSPLLANIYLHDLDEYMESNYLNLDQQARIRRRKAGKSNYLYVRYADDFVVLCNGTKAEALEMKEELKVVLDSMGLTLSEEKTKVTHITDIEQPLTRRNLIKPTNCFPKQAKDFNLHVVKTFNEVVDLALHRHADAVNPFQELEHPTQGWPLGWLVDLVW